MGEVKQANFRISAEAADRFRKFCEENNINQAQGFEHLMTVLELDQAKTVMPGRADDIEAFMDLSVKLQNAFKHSLELALTADDRANEHCRVELDLREEALKNAKEKLTEMEARVSELVAERDAARILAETAEKAERVAQEKAKSAEEVAEQTRKTYSILESKLTQAERNLLAYEEMKNAEEKLRGQLAELQRDLSEAKRTAETEKELAVERAIRAREQELEQEYRKRERELEQEYRQREEQLRNDNIRLQFKLEIMQEGEKA